MKKHWFLVIIAVGCLIWSIYNGFNNGKFLEASLIQILTLVVAIFISYFLVQHKNDRRRKADFINKMLQEIVLQVEDEGVLDADTSRAWTIQKSIANRLLALKDNGFKDIEQDMDYVIKEFEEIRELYSNHVDDLETVEKDINRHRVNISDKCTKIEASLFNV